MVRFIAVSVLIEPDEDTEAVEDSAAIACEIDGIIIMPIRTSMAAFSKFFDLGPPFGFGFDEFRSGEY